MLVHAQGVVEGIIAHVPMRCTSPLISADMGSRMDATNFSQGSSRRMPVAKPPPCCHCTAWVGWVELAGSWWAGGSTNAAAMISTCRPTVDKRLARWQQPHRVVSGRLKCCTCQPALQNLVPPQRLQQVLLLLQG